MLNGKKKQTKKGPGPPVLVLANTWDDFNTYLLSWPTKIPMSLHYGVWTPNCNCGVIHSTIFIKSILWSRKHSRDWDYSLEQSKTLPHKLSFYLGRQTSKIKIVIVAVDSAKKKKQRRMVKRIVQVDGEDLGDKYIRETWMRIVTSYKLRGGWNPETGTGIEDLRRARPVQRWWTRGRGVTSQMEESLRPRWGFWLLLKLKSEPQGRFWAEGGECSYLYFDIFFHGLQVILNCELSQ